MGNDQRRAAARRRAWGRGPHILRFESLEGRQLLSATSDLPDLTGQSITVPSSLTWGQTFEVKGTVVNQGTTTVTSPIQVMLYAAPSMGNTSGEVSLGTVTLPAGLVPGATASFDQQVILPSTPLSGTDPSGTVFVGMTVDPNGKVAESNESNNTGVGLGTDVAQATAAVPAAASLVGTSLQLSADTTEWGRPITVTEQITNNGTADAPATTALVVLTPSGSAIGGPSDVAIGSISIPAIAAGQSTTITRSITIPTIPPAALAGGSDFTLSIAQDADYVLNQVYPHIANQGVGADEALLTINTPAKPPAMPTALPQLVVTGVNTTTTSTNWGQSVQVTASLANGGSVAAGSVRVRFVLVGTDGTVNGIFLGDTAVSSLAAGGTTNVTANLKLPTTLPTGLNSQVTGRIAVILDPEQTIDRVPNSSNVGFSSTFKVQGPAGDTSASASTDDGAPTVADKKAATRKALAQAAAQKAAAKKAAALAARQAKLAARPRNPRVH